MRMDRRRQACKVIKTIDAARAQKASKIIRQKSGRSLRCTGRDFYPLAGRIPTPSQQRLLEDPLSMEILGGHYKPHAVIKVKAEGGQMMFA